MPESALHEEEFIPFCAGPPEPSPRRLEAYRRYAPAVPAGEYSEVQVMAARFVRSWLLAWRCDASCWWQMDDDFNNQPDPPDYQPQWQPKTPNEIRAFCFGFLAGAQYNSAVGRSKMADSVLREAKLLPWPYGQSAQNDMTGWVRQSLRPAEMGLGSVPTEVVMCRLLRDHPSLATLSRRSIEMRLAGAISEAWGHEQGVRQANGIIHENRRLRGWLGLEVRP